MAEIVAAMAMTHGPGLTGWFDAAPKDYQKLTLRATDEMRRRLADARPDVIVAFSNDHLLNWPINNTPERAYQIGTTLRETLRAYPGQERIAVLATGGLSHEPGGPRYFYVDEEFDHRFLELLAKGDHEALLRECTLDRMEEAGSGGTA